MKEKRVQIGHGGGGRMGRELIDDEILARFGEGPLAGLPDAACLPSLPNDIVFTTDSFVVQPFEFPGGNIGDLAVHGTVNDLAVAGAKPLWLSLALILEEGLEMDKLGKILDSVKGAADRCGVTIATGDTKVVGRGQADGLYVNTAGIGEALPQFSLDSDSLEAGDRILVSGPIGDHGAAVLAAREGIGMANGPRSDSAPVHAIVEALGSMAASIRFMRDPTRGGLAAVLNELVENRDIDIILDEDSIPLNETTHAFTEILGLDPLQLASEGRIVVVCKGESADAVLETLKSLPEGKDAASIGTVRESKNRNGRLLLATTAGGERIVDNPRGELLPRIC